MWPHEVEPWFHSWYIGRVETLDAKYNLAYINSTLCGYTNSSKRETLHISLLVWPHEVELWFHSWYRGRVETLDANI